MLNAESHTYDSMNNELQSRTKQFSLRILKLGVKLNKFDDIARVIAKQIIRSGTSVGAHYRESIRARSKKEMISKLEGGQQELEETKYWLELLVEGKIVKASQLSSLIEEADEIMAMLTASIRTLKSSKVG